MASRPRRLGGTGLEKPLAGDGCEDLLRAALPLVCILRPEPAIIEHAFAIGRFNSKLDVQGMGGFECADSYHYY